MATDVEIANQALLRVGAESITSAEWTTPTNERSRAVSNSWPFVRREVLRAHPWNSVTKRRTILAEAALSSYLKPNFDFSHSFKLPDDCLRVLEVDVEGQWRVERAPVSVTSAGTYSSSYPQVVSSEVRIVTAADHNLGTGALCYVSSASDDKLNGQLSHIEKVNDTTVRFPDIDQDGFTDGSLVGGVLASVEEAVALVADTEGPVGIRYIEDETNPAFFDSMLTEAIVLRLAVEIVERVTDSTRKREALMAEYADFMREVKHIEGQEQSPSKFEEDLWISSRY